MTVTEHAKHEAATTPAWSGINHLALVTTDMDATVRFYHGVLGARLVATVGTPTFRHYFFEFGPQCTVAFFEYAGLPSSRSPSRPAFPTPARPSSTTSPSTCPTRTRCTSCGERLADAGCEVTDIVDHGSIHSVYFTDPNGIALEASWWVIDVTGARSTTTTAALRRPEPRSRRRRTPRHRDSHQRPDHAAHLDPSHHWRREGWLRTRPDAGAAPRRHRPTRRGSCRSGWASGRRRRCSAQSSSASSRCSAPTADGGRSPSGWSCVRARCSTSSTASSRSASSSARAPARPAGTRTRRDTAVFLDANSPQYIGGILEMANARLYGFWGG